MVARTQPLNGPAIGAAIRRERLRRGMKLVALARAAGCNRITIWRVETGRIQRPTVEFVDAVARALGMGPARLLKAAARP